MKLFVNSVISLLAGAIAFMIMSRFTNGDMPIIVALWVAIITSMLLNFYSRMKK